MLVIDVDLHDSDNSFITNLGGARGRGWRHPVNDAGAGQITLSPTDGDVASCTRKRLLKFKLDGTVVFGAVIGPRAQQTISPQESSGEQRTLGGAGLASLLNGGRVLPQLGVGERAPSSRGFGAMSDAYDDSTWDPAVELYRQDDPVNGYGPLWPAGWKCPDAFWIWSRAGAFADPPMPVGTSCFRAILTVPADGEVSIDIAADDGWRLWLDGELAEQRVEAYAWRQLTTVTRFLEAGDHVVYIEAVNIDRPISVTNFAGLIFGAYTVVSGGEIGTVLLVSDASVKCLDYPSSLPTMTPGAIWQVLLDELHALGFLNEITQGSWDADVDELGNAWVTPIAPTYTVGTGLFDVARNQADVAIDFDINPDTLQLRIYNKGTLGGASGVTLTKGTHYFDMSHQDADDPPTHLLVKVADGRTVLRSSGTGGRPVLGYIEAGTATNDSQADLAAQAVFDVQPRQLRAALAVVAGAIPYTNLVPGSTFTTLDIDGTPSAATMLAITVADTPADQDGTVGGAAVFAIEAVQ